ncbi:hypothetical protein [Nocardioides sp. NPDC047086]|uniref:hypothetical protein n=1 Tax=Nocardioides sp. NPDC047086 TaxID=3154810 RepID=UPI003403D159
MSDNPPSVWPTTSSARTALARPTRLGRRVAFSREQIAGYLTVLEADAVHAA